MAKEWVWKKFLPHQKDIVALFFVPESDDVRASPNFPEGWRPWGLYLLHAFYGPLVPTSLERWGPVVWPLDFAISWMDVDRNYVFWGAATWKEALALYADRGWADIDFDDSPIRG